MKTRSASMSSAKSSPSADEATDQSEVIAFLSDPAAYGAGVAEVRQIVTHGAVVFLAGAEVYKLKRAVRFPYMDFSTLARREAAVRAEVAINRRTAPELYLGEIPVVRGREGALAIGGEGEVVDWLVRMRRFDEAGLFDRLAARGALTPALIEALADAVVRFQEEAERRPAFGGAAGIARVLAENREGWEAAGAEVLDPGAIEEADRRGHLAFERTRTLLEARRQGGRVRHCHGDLHLRNICLIDGRPTLFDAIEFNDDIANVDTLFDFAFLVMDLVRVRLTDLANLVLNRYLDAACEYEGLAVLPLFLAARAGIRAQTEAAAARAQHETRHRHALVAEARRCLMLAAAFLEPPAPRLVAIGGLSGSGKSTLAQTLAPAIGMPPGAILLRSDIIRKRLHGVDPLARLQPSAYAPEVTARVYAELQARAARALAAGFPVVLDAVFARGPERAAAAALAEQQRVPFAGLWLEAPAELLLARVGARAHDASDATPEIVRRQLGYALEGLVWPRLDASGSPEDILAAARARLGIGAGDGWSQTG